MSHTALNLCRELRPGRWPKLKSYTRIYAVAILRALADYCNEKSMLVFVSAERLAMETGISRNTVAKYLHYLELLQLIEATGERKGKGGAKEYNLRLLTRHQELSHHVWPSLTLEKLYEWKLRTKAAKDAQFPFKVAQKREELAHQVEHKSESYNQEFMRSSSIKQVRELVVNIEAGLKKEVS